MVQQKKTDPIDLSELDEALVSLTDQQHAFWEAMDSGNYTQEDAYKIAYPASVEWTKNARQVAASRLWNNAKFMLCRTALARATTKRAERSKDQRIARMEELRELCIATGNLGAAFQCEQAVGKLEGHYIEKSEVLKRDSREELELLIELAKDGSSESIAFARKQAKDLGILDKFEHSLMTVQ